MFPALSRAMADTVCGPLATAAVFHVIAYGAVVSSGPAGTPSSLNWTPATDTLSVAFAAIDTMPPTVDMLAGEVIDTAGALVSLKTLTITEAVEVFPAASRASAVSACAPLAASAVFQLRL